MAWAPFSPPQPPALLTAEAIVSHLQKENPGRCCSPLAIPLLSASALSLPVPETRSRRPGWQPEMPVLATWGEPGEALDVLPATLKFTDLPSGLFLHSWLLGFHQAEKHRKRFPVFVSRRVAAGGRRFGLVFPSAFQKPAVCEAGQSTHPARLEDLLHGGINTLQPVRAPCPSLFGTFFFFPTLEL